jgi:RHS repeat-associated protein
VTGLTWSAGDKLGFRAVGSTLTAYHYTGGAWSSVASRTDSTYASGYIGLESYSTSWTLDDFGGGAAVHGMVPGLSGGKLFSPARRLETSPAALPTPAPDQTWKLYYYAGGQRVAMRTLSAGQLDVVNYFVNDQLGSTTLTLDANGALAGQIRYYAFGETRLATGSMATDKLYTGQRSVMGLGLYDYNARFYDPYLKRFISADTVVPKVGTPQALNRYSYALNSPLKYIDPTGHMVSDDPHWASAFEQAHGHPPSPQDKFDSDFAETHPGSLQNGQWTGRDWKVYGDYKATVSSDKGKLVGNRVTSLAAQQLPIGPDVNARHGSGGDLTSPWPCELLDCGLSVVGFIASGVATFTSEGAPEVAGVAQVVDIGASVWSFFRTVDDYNQHKISETRLWALNVTDVVGAINLPPPIPVGLAFSLFNVIFTFTGLPK